MDWRKIGARIPEYAKKYKYVILIIFMGMVLISIPEKNEKEAVQPEEKETENTEPNLQNELEEILKHLSGAGDVRVLLTEAAGEEIRYQTDESQNASESLKKETVLITDAQRVQNGLVRQINPPKYQGAVILCQGAGNPEVCLSISKAVANATGLSFDKITVLKMK